MPRIIVNRYERAHPGEFISQGFSRAGDAFRKGIQDYGEIRRTAVQQAKENEQKDQELAISAQRAAAQLEREKRLGLATAGASDQKAAEQQGLAANVDEFGARQSARSFLTEALSSPGGALGPFGMLNPQGIRKGAEKSIQTQASLAPKIAVAKRMGPVQGKAWLEKEVETEKRGILADAYAREAKQIDKAVQDGVIDEAQAKLFTQALQEQIKTQKPPGEIENRLAHNYNIVAKLKARAVAWTNADKKAADMMGAVEQLVAQMPDGIDPTTGESLKAAQAERLATARSEWAKTEFPTHRMESDPDEQLAVLQKIMFGVQAAGGGMPEQTQTERMPGLRFLPGEQEKLSQMGQAMSENRTATLGRGPVPGRKAQPAPQGGAAPRTVADISSKTAPKARRTLSGADDEKALRSAFRDRAQKALQAGGDVRSAFRGLVESIASDLGVDPRAPDVLEIIGSELDNLTGKADKRGG